MTILIFIADTIFQLSVQYCHLAAKLILYSCLEKCQSHVYPFRRQNLQLMQVAPSGDQIRITSIYTDVPSTCVCTRISILLFQNIHVSPFDGRINIIFIPTEAPDTCVSYKCMQRHMMAKSIHVTMSHCHIHPQKSTKHWGVPQMIFSPARGVGKTFKNIYIKSTYV